MKLIYYSCIACLSILFSFSCGKKVDQPINTPTTHEKLMRDWSFISMEVRHEYVEEKTFGADRLKNVVKTGYITEKNGGSCLFDETKVTSTNLEYEVNTAEKRTSYRNDTLINSSQTPLNFKVSHSGFLSDYTMLGTDSLKMNSGPIKIKPGAVSQPVSVKLQFDNDKLYMIYKFGYVSSPGAQVKESETADVTITLQKK